MDFLDDEAGASGEDVLVPSSQNEGSERPRKRRRIARRLGTDEDSDYDLPSNDYTQDDYVDYEDPEDLIQKSKYEEVTHVPQHARTQKETFVTQLTQPWSSPTRIRGARWQRQRTPPSPSTIRVAEVRDQRPLPEQLVGRPIATSALTLGPATHPIDAIAQEVFPEEDQTVVDDDFGEDDPELLEALISTEAMQDGVLTFSNAPQNAPSLRQTTLFGMHTTQRPVPATQSDRAHNWPLSKKNEKPTHHEIDREAMKTWVYPTNLGKIRDYQYNIVHKGLFHNLLVALPTGLGKTFIAATIMLNWYRWTKNAQIVFVAPTKPLVAQQIEACFHIAGIPRSQTTLLTGEISPAIRGEEWQEKRVFFMTPQTLINDLKNGYADPKKIVLVVVDEAHKATGNYAYVEVIRFLQNFNSSFRVLALTATPGSTVESVQKVIDGLNISRIEIRTEDSMDIRQFVHSRDETLELFDYSMEIEETLELFRKAAQPLQNRLCSQQAYWNKDPVDNTLFGLRKAQEQWQKSEAGRKAEPKIKVPMFKSFSALMTLAHGVELLKFHGIGPFYSKMKAYAEDVDGSKYHRDVSESRHFKEMMNRINTWINLPDFVGHPKLSYLKTVALNHFMDAGEGQGAAGGRPPSETRIMVFAHYRDSAEEIVRVLKKHEPMVRPHIFVGQSSTKGSEGMDQKTQQKVIGEFKGGKHNVLVATSIGEEGLDIGEVDLIICYDASKSPIRMLQRMGRTGRKRAGNVHILLMRGKEERDFAKAKDNYRKMQEIIESGQDFQFHEEKCFRIVPKEIQPVVDKRVVEIPVENTQDVSIEPKRRKTKNAKKPPKRFNMPDGVETGFQFLGGGKKSKKAPKPSEPVLDIYDAAVPPLDSVLLSNYEEVTRQATYGEVSGTGPQYITTPAFDKHSRPFRRLTQTDKVGHSKASEVVARVYKNVRNRGENCARPTSEEVMQDFGLCISSDEFRETPNGRKPGKAARKVKTPAPTSLSLSSPRSRSPTVQDEDDYAEMGSFIDDGPLDGDEAAQSTEATSPDTLMDGLDPPGKGASSAIPFDEEEPFWDSQRQQPVEESDEEELPDISAILGQKTVSPVRMKPRRRVVESDDEDE
jgi:ATP-dependent DNA helicase MPH1